MVGKTITIQDVNDPSFIRRNVSAKSFAGWTKSKTVPGGRMGGHRTFVQIDEAKAEAIKNADPKAPRVPAVVEEVKAVLKQDIEAASPAGEAEEAAPKVAEEPKERKKPGPKPKAK